MPKPSPALPNAVRFSLADPETIGVSRALPIDAILDIARFAVSLDGGQIGTRISACACDLAFKQRARVALRLGKVGQGDVSVNQNHRDLEVKCPRRQNLRARARSPTLCQK